MDADHRIYVHFKNELPASDKNLQSILMKPVPPTVA